jgi:hypothetical protein
VDGIGRGVDAVVRRVEAVETLLEFSGIHRYIVLKFNAAAQSGARDSLVDSRKTQARAIEDRCDGSAAYNWSRDQSWRDRKITPRARGDAAGRLAARRRTLRLHRPAGAMSRHDVSRISPRGAICSGRGDIGEKPGTAVSLAQSVRGGSLLRTVTRAAGPRRACAVRSASEHLGASAGDE